MVEFNSSPGEAVPTPSILDQNRPLAEVVQHALQHAANLSLKPV